MPRVRLVSKSADVAKRSSVLFWCLMHPIELTHLSFVRKRTAIRHDKLVLWWMKQCWAVAPAGDPTTTTPPTAKLMTREHYDAFYRKLLGAMTVKWEDQVWTETVDEMWARDAGSFHTIDFNRFCCSIFSFAEMWVDALELAEYTRVLKLICRVSTSTASDATTIARRSNPATLSAFLMELQQQRRLEQENVSLGKSVSFDPQHFTEAFGSSVPLISSSNRTGCQPSSRIRRHTTAKPLPKIHADAFTTRPRSRSAFVRVDEASNQSLDVPGAPFPALSALAVRPRTTTAKATRQQPRSGIYSQ